MKEIRKTDKIVEAIVDAMDFMVTSPWRWVKAYEVHKFLRHKIWRSVNPKFSKRSEAAFGQCLALAVPLLEEKGIKVDRKHTSAGWTYLFTREEPTEMLHDLPGYPPGHIDEDGKVVLEPELPEQGEIEPGAFQGWCENHVWSDVPMTKAELHRRLRVAFRFGYDRGKGTGIAIDIMDRDAEREFETRFLK